MLRVGVHRGMYEGGGAGRHDQDQDNAEMHELFVIPARVYYLLAGPRLAEAHDTSTVEPLTGSARSAPKPLTISNLLHSQHLSDDQHKDVINEHLVQTRPAQFDFMNGHPLNVLPKGMRPPARPPSTTTTSTGIGRSPRTPSSMTAAGVRACTRPAAMTAAGRTGSRTEGTANPSRRRGVSGYLRGPRRQGTHKTGGAGRQDEQGTYEDRGAGRQDTRAPTDFYQAGTKQTDFYQAGTKQGVKNYEDGGAGRQDTRAPTNFYQAGTKQTDFYQAGTRQGVKDYEDGGTRRPDTREPTDIYQAGTKQTDVYQAGTETGVKKAGRGRGRQ